MWFVRMLAWGLAVVCYLGGSILLWLALILFGITLPLPIVMVLTAVWVVYWTIKDSKKREISGNK